jgi:TldD protein
VCGIRLTSVKLPNLRGDSMTARIGARVFSKDHDLQIRRNPRLLHVHDIWTVPVVAPRNLRGPRAHEIDPTDRLSGKRLRLGLHHLEVSMYRDRSCAGKGLHPSRFLPGNELNELAAQRQAGSARSASDVCKGRQSCAFAFAVQPTYNARDSRGALLMRACRFAAACSIFLVLGTVCSAGDRASSTVLQAMNAELERSMQKLKAQPVPPYFLSYEIVDTHSFFVTGAFGQLTGSNESHHRQLNIDLRVGDYTLDNEREVRGGIGGRSFPDISVGTVPLDNDPDAIRAALWYRTDERYKHAMEQYTKVKTNVQVHVAAEDKSDDFSHEQAQQYTEPPVDVKVDRHLWEDRVRKYTAPFAKHTDIYGASAIFTASADTRWFVNSEGTRIQTSQPVWRLFLIAYTKADDGMELPRYESFLGFSEKDLPDDGAVLKVVDKMIGDLEALRVAPVADPYTGPAILSGRASGVFFHEIFGHRVEGHREKLSGDAQTFKKMINEDVLPKDFSVYFDPTARRMAGTALAGYYLYDDQGIKARRVDVVQDGVLKTFLMSRTPIQGIAQSNGHGRAQPGLNPVARQSNLIVDVAPSAVQPDLKKLLIAEIKKRGLPYGLYFEDISGGFTFTGRIMPNAFNVTPLMVYRIFPDGREQLVRGVDLIGTPLTTFSKIEAADNHVAVFNGICGAESGGVPVSAVSPAILISQIEVQKKVKSQSRAPILPAPFENPQDREPDRRD